MNSREALLLAVLTALPTVAAAQEVPAQVSVTGSRELGKVSEQVTTQLTATVEAVDSKARTVTLKGPQGNLVTVLAGDEVRNLDQIHLGDLVEVRYTLGVALQLVKGGAGLPTRVESEASSRAPKGEKPAGTALREVTVLADVIALNSEKQTVTLRGPERTVELQVRDRAQFNNIAVGDQVEATFTEGAAISVEAAPKK